MTVRTYVSLRMIQPGDESEHHRLQTDELTTHVESQNAVERSDAEELRAVLNDFLRKEVLPVVDEMESLGEFPATLVEELISMGVPAITVPGALGGLGGSTRLYTQVIADISSAWIALAGTLTVHAMVIELINKNGSSRQRGRYLPRLLGGELGAVAITEPGAGSDIGSLQTRAVEARGGFVLNGTKHFITSGGCADMYVVLAQNGSGMSLFVIEDDQPGLHFGPAIEKMGYSSSPTRTMFLDDCEVSGDQLLGKPEDGLKEMLAALDFGRLGVAAMAVGLSRAALHAGLEYAKNREQFGQRISEFQGLQFMIADMRANTEAARQLLHFASAARDNGRPYTFEACMAKLFASDNAMSVTTHAVQLLGGYGYTKDYPVERYMREAKMLQIVEGTNEIQRSIIARYALDEADQPLFRRGIGDRFPTGGENVRVD